SILVSVVVNYFIDTWNNLFIQFVSKIILLPIIVGIGFEFLMYAGRHDNLFTKICSAPGLWMQRITTKEPDDGMIECAIMSLKASMPQDFPDFEYHDPHDDVKTDGDEKAEETEAEKSDEEA
ncbi:MAG: DUF1385 domain-containing protein, partial [Firmicutes bacterium]|nr:DUF1385 domain-containing protein [Candidatus Colimorpha enterica]